MNLFDLVAKITLDDKEYKDKVKDSEESGKSLGAKLATAGKVAAGAFTVVSGTVAAVGGAMINATGKTAEYADNIDKMSQKLGMSAKAYQEWDFIAQHSGTTVDGLQASMKTLSVAAENGKDTFEKLGLSLDEVRNMSQEDLFSAVITQLQGMEEGTERTALASELLGRSATELAPLLNTSAEATEEMRKQVHELGGVMSDDAVKAGANYQDSLQNLQTAIGGLKKGLTGNMMPAITKVMDGLTAIFTGGDGIGKITEGISELIDNITEAMPKFVEAGKQILTALTTAIIDNLPQLIQMGIEVIVTLISGIAEALPQLIPAAVDAIIQITEALIDNVDLLVDGAIALIIGLAEALVDATPRLIEKAPTIVLKLVEAIIRNAPKLLYAAIELISSLARGIINALGTIVQVAKDTVSKFVDGVKSWFSKLLSLGKEVVDSVKNGIKSKISDATTWGKDLLNNFINGIKSKIQSLKNAVSNVAQTVRNFLHFTEPDEGPLADFHTYSPDMIDLFIEGMKKNQRRLRNAVADTFDFREDMNLTPSFAVSGASATYSGGGFVDSLTNNLVEAMANMRIYLDSGEMVGAMTPALDRSLGVEITHRGRAN